MSRSNQLDPCQIYEVFNLFGINRRQGNKMILFSFLSGGDRYWSILIRYYEPSILVNDVFSLKSFPLAYSFSIYSECLNACRTHELTGLQWGFPSGVVASVYTLLIRRARSGMQTMGKNGCNHLLLFSLRLLWLMVVEKDKVGKPLQLCYLVILYFRGWSGIKDRQRAGLHLRQIRAGLLYTLWKEPADMSPDQQH